MRTVAETNLLSLRQGHRPVEDYCSEFRRWSGPSLWNDPALCCRICQGLLETLKDLLINDPQPTTLKEFMSLEIRPDRQLPERTRERTDTSFPPPFTRETSVTVQEPMQLGTMSPHHRRSFQGQRAMLLLWGCWPLDQELSPNVPCRKTQAPRWFSGRQPGRSDMVTDPDVDDKTLDEILQKAIDDIATDPNMDKKHAYKILRKVFKDIADDAKLEKKTVAKMFRKARKHIAIEGEDNSTVSKIIQKVNKDTSYLIGGDIRRVVARTVMSCTKCLWMKSQNGIVQVPYVISSVYTLFEISMFYMAMQELATMTCIQFVNRTTEHNYASIENGASCSSNVGKIGGKQIVSLAMPNCIKYNLVVHELMHLLGFFHEHTRIDRDNYIDIMWNNIAQDDNPIFMLDNGNLQNMPYDFTSVLHYDKNAYSSVPGQPSMVAKSDPSITLGKAIGLNNKDLMKINLVYQCNLCTEKLITPGTTTYSFTSSGQQGVSCLYLIQSSLKVLLRLSNINVPLSPNCNDAYVKVYDGVGISSPVLLDKMCGSGPVPPLISSGSFILVEILNSYSLALSIFMTYDTVRYGGTFLTNNTLVTSPRFPVFYPSNVDVFYSIIAPLGYKVSLTNYFMKTQTSPKCSIDYLAAYDGPLQTSPILGRYCISIPVPTPLVSTGNVMVLHFHSGVNTGFNGFNAKYQFVPSN